jgi:hypothetical protein
MSKLDLGPIGVSLTISPDDSHLDDARQLQLAVRDAGVVRDVGEQVGLGRLSCSRGRWRSLRRRGGAHSHHTDGQHAAEHGGESYDSDETQVREHSFTEER